MSDELLTTEEAAAILGVRPGTVRAWVREGKLQPTKNLGSGSGNGYRFSLAYIRDFEVPNRGRGAPPVVPGHDHTAIARRYIDGETYQDIADDYNVSRERIRQIVKQVDPGASKRRKLAIRLKEQRQREAEEARALKAAMQDALDNDRKCLVCGCWVLRPHKNVKTCSHECSVAWPILRTFDNATLHRIHQARSILRHPERNSKSRIEWAKRMLSDDPPPQDRRYFATDSERAEVIRKYRPEEFRRIVEQAPEGSVTHEEYADDL